MNYQYMKTDDGRVLGKKWRDENGVINMEFAPKQYETRPHQFSKPSVQGYNGVSNGAMGYIGGLVKNNKQGVNTLVSDIAQRGVYKPFAHKAKDATSAEWFNEALSNIMTRKRQQMDMERRRVLGNVVGSMMRNQASRYNTDANVNIANMRSINSANQLRETKRWHDIMGKYYDALGTAASQKANAKTTPNEADMQKVYNKRWEIVAKNPDNVIPNFSKLNEEDKSFALNYYVKNGKAPKVVMTEAGITNDEYGIYKDEYTQPQLYNQSNDNRTTIQNYDSIDGRPIVDIKTSSDGTKYIKIRDY